MLTGQSAFHHQFSTLEDDQGNRSEDEEDDEGGEGAAPNRAPHREGADVLDAFQVAHHFPGFIGETFDADDSGKGFLDDGVGLSDLVLRALREFSNKPAKQNGCDDHHRQRSQHQQGQRYGEVEQGEDAAHDDDELPKQFRQRRGKYVLNGCDIRRDSAIQIAHAPRIEEFHGHAHNGLKRVVAHGEHHVFGHFGKEHNATETQGGLDSEDDEDEPTDLS